MSVLSSPDENPYRPDKRLRSAYDEAILLDEAGIEGLCPSYVELTEAASRYEDKELLGRGAVKDVYRTYDHRTKRWVAMARLRKDRGPEFYDLFVHEAWLTASLCHPNIINVHDTGVDAAERPFFTMDLKGNQTLADLVTHQKGKDRRSLLIIFNTICDAIAYAHSKRVIHLDLKPENIQADQFGEVLLCDWGLGKLIEADEDEIPELSEFEERDNMTLLGQVKGSPGYMAPEQVLPEMAKDQRTDVFSLGCLLHFILTGQPPFTGDASEVIEKTKAAKISPPNSHLHDQKIPNSLAAVLAKALNCKPDDRYQTALELQHEVQNYLDGFSTDAEHPGFFREARLFIRRNRIPVAIATIALGAIFSLALHFGQRLERQNQVADAERSRATQFESEAEKVIGLYESMRDRTEDEKKRLSGTFVTSANRFKNIGIFTNPGYTVRECQKLIDAAATLTPNHIDVRTQQVSLDCITLNFKRVVEDPARFGANDPDYLSFAQAFPNFAYNERERPRPQQLAEFYQKAREISTEHPFLMERIAAYDFVHRSDKDQYLPVVETLLEYLNGGRNQFKLEHSPQDSSLTVSSDEEFQALLLPLRGSGKSILRFLHFRHLRLELSQGFNLRHLAGLQIESLDLRACEQPIITENLQLPNLRKIILRTDQIVPDRLLHHLKSSEKITITKDSSRF